jgi:hypothetical protein
MSDVQAIDEFDQTHFYVAGFCQITGSGHHGFHSLRIGGDQRRVVTARKLCLSDNFLTGLIDEGHEPKLIDALNAIWGTAS